MAIIGIDISWRKHRRNFYCLYLIVQRQAFFCASIDRVFMEKKLAANGSAGSSNII